MLEDSRLVRDATGNAAQNSGCHSKDVQLRWHEGEDGARGSKRVEAGVGCKCRRVGRIGEGMEEGRRCMQAVLAGCTMLFKMSLG
jgi:hypothetical protein